ncbi:sensor histidine kinase [Halobaculum sp. MBLA0147]|uniref:sensor histidine kinase n=1 Tax=Halobaculum sp. MBLA0147 TaxID=3079934 RepID=UPI0035259BA3
MTEPPVGDATVADALAARLNRPLVRATPAGLAERLAAETVACVVWRVSPEDDQGTDDDATPVAVVPPTVPTVGYAVVDEGVDDEHPPRDEPRTATRHVPRGVSEQVLVSAPERPDELAATVAGVAAAYPDADRLGAFPRRAPFPVVAGWLRAETRPSLLVWDANEAYAATFDTSREAVRGVTLVDFPEPTPVADRPGEAPDADAPGSAAESTGTPDTRSRSSRPYDEALARATATGEPTTLATRLPTGADETSFRVTVIPAADTDEGDATEHEATGAFVWASYVDVTDHAVDRRRVAALHDAALSLASAGTPAAVHETVASATDELAAGERCAVFHERDGVLEPVATAGATSLRACRSHETGTGAVGRAHASGSVTVVDDPDADETAVETDGTVVAVPVGEWGVVRVVAAESGAVDAFQRDLVYTLGAHAAAALSRVDREQSSRLHRRRLDRLHEATRELVDASDEHAATTRAVDVAADLLETPGCAVHRYDSGAERLRVAASRDTSTVSAVPRDPGEGVVGVAYETGSERAVGVDGRRDETPAGGGGPGRGGSSDHADRSGDEPTPPPGAETVVAYPLGDHGVLSVYADASDAVDTRVRHLGRVLASNVETVLDSLADERVLRRREAQLTRQNERLERFASVVSHDLRSPLEVARGNAELAQIEGDLDRLDDVLDALDRANRLVDDTLSFARQGTHVGDVSPVALRRVARDAWESVHVEGHESGRQADGEGDEPAANGAGESSGTDTEASVNDGADGSTETDTEASANDGADEAAASGSEESVAVGAATLVCETDARVRADERRLQRLLENLFRNAVEHNDRPVTVRVTATDDGFAVVDDGVGLPSLPDRDLFDPGTTTSDDGTGFGLSIVRQVADAHGWTVDAETAADGGARFVFDTDPAT